MDCTRIVVRQGPREGWTISGGKGELGPYHSRDMALRVAISEALAVRRSGRPARVALDDADGSVIAERCLCERFGAANR